VRGRSHGEKVEGLAFAVNGTGTGKPEQRLSATGIYSAHSGAVSAALQPADLHSDSDCIKWSASDIASARLLRWMRSSSFLQTHVSHRQRMISVMKS
jgi:hypothetical protein